MSTELQASLRDYVVIITDIPNTTEKRTALLQRHNEESGWLLKAGRVPFFGSTLAQHNGPGESAVENGTVMVLKAESEDEIREIFKKDVWVEQGVWDMNTLQIFPYLWKYPRQ